jgi:hypothetical protein
VSFEYLADLAHGELEVLIEVCAQRQGVLAKVSACGPDGRGHLVLVSAADFPTPVAVSAIGCEAQTVNADLRNVFDDLLDGPDIVDWPAAIRAAIKGHFCALVDHGRWLPIVGLVALLAPGLLLALRALLR